VEFGTINPHAVHDDGQPYRLFADSGRVASPPSLNLSLR